MSQSSASGRQAPIDTDGVSEKRAAAGRCVSASDLTLLRALDADAFRRRYHARGLPRRFRTDRRRFTSARRRRRPARSPPRVPSPRRLSRSAPPHTRRALARVLRTLGGSVLSRREGRRTVVEVECVLSRGIQRRPRAAAVRARARLPLERVDVPCCCTQRPPGVLAVRARARLPLGRVDVLWCCRQRPFEVPAVHT